MVVKVYISGISGNKEVKKRQQRVLMILDSKNIKYEIIDITEPGREADKDFMQNNAKSNGGTVSDPNPRSPLPPQMFNDEEYCGDYEQFDLANEVDTLEQFLKVEVPPEEPQAISNGDVKNEEEKDDVKNNDNADESKENEVVTESANNEEPNPEEAASKERKSLKESSPEKETAAERLKPDEENTTHNEEDLSKDETNVENKEAPQEQTPLKDEVNGAISSREPSNEKEINDVEKIIENPSEALIQSEQVASVE